VSSAPAFASPPAGQSSFNVTATVAGSCTISATNADTGTYDPGQNYTNYGSGAINHQCTPGITPVISLNFGLVGTTFFGQDMTIGGDGIFPFLHYYISWSSLFADIAGDGTDGTSTYSATADGNLDTANYYVAVQDNQYNLIVGNYSDTVTDTISW